jgi:UPF0271 protein
MTGRGHQGAAFKTARLPDPVPRRYVLDTSLVLGGRDPPRDGTWSTTPEAAAEIQPGGRDHRRFEGWLAAGLRIESAPPETLEKVADAALSAGNLGRLSPADLSLLALAMEQQATLISDDFTVLDVAMRLVIPTQTVNQDAPKSTLDFRPRCLGCGRWFDVMPKKEECPVCGSGVKLKPNPPASKAAPGTPTTGSPVGASGKGTVPGASSSSPPHGAGGARPSNRPR